MREYSYIVKVDNGELSLQRGEYHVFDALKGCGSVFQTKRHMSELVWPVVKCSCCLLLVWEIFRNRRGAVAVFQSRGYFRLHQKSNGSSIFCIGCDYEVSIWFSFLYLTEDHRDPLLFVEWKVGKAHYIRARFITFLASIYSISDVSKLQTFGMTQ